MKYYALRGNEFSGIYTNWDDCKDLRKGGELKSFKTEKEALMFLNYELDYEKDKYKDEKENFVITDKVYSFVDGSFNEELGLYGCGGFLVVDGTKYEISGASGDSLNEMRNVAGEILGARLAIEKAIELNLKELTIFYDYLGIEMWATKKWKANKEGTKSYVEFIDSVSDKIKLSFKKVRGHIGIPGNEEADKIAKKAVCII